jgi:hypothetical protein
MVLVFVEGITARVSYSGRFCRLDKGQSVAIEVYAAHFAAGAKNAEDIRCAGLSNPSQVSLRYLVFRGSAFPSILLTGPVWGSRPKTKQTGPRSGLHPSLPKIRDHT